MHKKRVGKRDYFYTTIRDKDKVRRIYLGNNYKIAKLKEDKLKYQGRLKIDPLMIYNFSLLAAFLSTIITLILFIPGDSSITGYSIFSSSSDSDFGAGTYSQTGFNATYINAVQLNISSFKAGNYTSKVFDANVTSSWDNLTWSEGVPYQEELLSNLADELKNNYMNGTNMSGNVLYYRFNNNSAVGENEAYIYDFSGNDRWGNVSNQTTYIAGVSCTGTPYCPKVTTEGKFNNAYIFDRKGGIINVTKYVIFSEEITISWWFLNKGTDIINNEMVTGGGNGNTYTGLNSQERLTFFYRNETGPGGGVSRANSCFGNTLTIRDQAWHLATFTASNITGVIQIYLDGKNNTATAAGWCTQPYDFGYIQNENWIFIIGQNSYTSSIVNNLNMTLDELAVWNRTLTPNEVFDVYKRGALRLNLSVRSCDDALCDGESWSSAFENASFNSLSLTNNRYFQYKAEMESNSTWLSPELYNITTGYTPQNTAPTFNLSIIPATAYSNTTILNGTFTVNDVDGDTLTVTTEWLNNSIKYFTRTFTMGNGFNSTNLSTDVWYKGNNWTFNITITDGTATIYNETSITISNTIPDKPTLSAPANSSRIKRLQSVNLTTSCTDIDSNDNTYYQVYNETANPPTILGSNQTNNGTWTFNVMEIEGSIIYWYVKCGDGTGSSVNSNINQFNVTYTPNSTINIFPSIIYTNTSKMEGNVTIKDGDLDVMDVCLNWYNNSVLYNGKCWDDQNNGTQLNLTVGDSIMAKNENWTLRVDISDGIANFSNLTSIIISNTRPSIPEIVSPENNTYTLGNRSTLLEIVASSDIDSDSLNYYFYVGEDSTTSTLAQSNTSIRHERGIETRGTRYYWKVDSYDGTLYSDNTTISTYLVNKLPRNGTDINITNEFNSAAINTTDSINCTTIINNDDIGGGSTQKINSTLYIWNGTESYKTYERINLDNNTFISWGLNDSLKGIQYANETWKCGLQLFDSLEYSTQINTSEITISDVTSPSINLIYPNNNTGDNDGNITFNYNVTDELNIANCSLIVGAGANQTESSITKEIAQSFSTSNLSIGYYNWSVNCTDNSNNIGSSVKRLISLVITTEFSGRTTNLSAMDDINNVVNFTIENPEYGFVNFSQNINLGIGLNLTSGANISFNRIEINSSDLSQLNVTAKLTFYNLTFSDPRPVRDGSACSSDICTEISYSGGTFVYDVTGFSVYSAEETPIAAAAAATVGGGAGGGGLGGQIEIPLKFVPEEIKTKMVTVAIEKKSIKLQNDGDIPLKIELSIKGLENIVELEEKTIEIPPYSSKEISLVIKAPEKAGVYNGELIADSKRGKISSIIIVEVESENPAFEVILNIPENYKEIYSEDEIAFKIDITNKGIISEGNTQLTYLIRDSLGNEIYRQEESQLIKDKLSLIKKIKTPKLKSGTYVSIVELKYKDTIAVSSSTFRIKSKEEIVKENMLLNIILSISIVILMIALVVYSTIKRFKIKLKKKDLNKIKDGYKKGSLSREAYERLFKKR